MNKEEILEGLKEVLGTVKSKQDMSGVTMQTELVSELGIDSLSMLLVSLAAEQKFNIQFETAQPFSTVGEVVEFIAGAIK